MEETTQPQSDILTPEQVNSITTDTPTEVEEQKLPSEQGEELIAGKFKSNEELLKAYQELESKLKPPEEAPPVDEEYETWKQQKALNDLLSPVGGLEAYNKAVEWAKESLPEAEINEFNKAIEEATGNEGITRVLAKSLIDKYTLASKTTTQEPQGGPIHSSGTQKVTGVKGYATKSDMMKDMSDPRYERDEGYRQQVAAKVAMTDESQWYKGLPRY